MIDTKTSLDVQEAWRIAYEYGRGNTMNNAVLREELSKRGIGYYKLREYLQCYLPWERVEDVEKTLDIIYYPQAKNFRDNDIIPINLTTLKEMKQKESEILIVNKSDNPLPEYKTPGSSGMDVMAYITEEEAEGRQYNLMPGERRLFHTGLYAQLPEGLEIQVRSRSGMALKYGVIVLNAPGTIDADYRGEIGVVLINLSKNSYTVKSGERIAQLVVANYVKASLTEVDSLDETERGEGGFGSTGVR